MISSFLVVIAELCFLLYNARKKKIWRHIHMLTMIYGTWHVPMNRIWFVYYFSYSKVEVCRDLWNWKYVESNQNCCLLDMGKLLRVRVTLNSCESTRTLSRRASKNKQTETKYNKSKQINEKKNFLTFMTISTYAYTMWCNKY